MDLEKVLAELTLDEKASLTAGADMWSIPAVRRLDLPSIRVTDGPNGARGSSLLGTGRETSACVPCGSALGATFSPALIERVGVMLGQEAHTKSCRVLLAPTINLHRSPLGGRNFECYSEDPLLAGKIAAAFVRGVQSQGVATTAKHFVANDAEFERNTIDSVVDERALRELYLLPFELAVREGGSLGIMTSYNRLNGTYCSEDHWLLSEVLRGEWGFEGFVVTDWFGVGSTDASARAGLDLQMPGPGRFFGAALADAVRAGEVDESLLDAQVSRMLSVWERLGALAEPGDGSERSVNEPEHHVLAREAATESMVLLRNDGLLPLEPSALRRVAVLGPNAERGQIMGGGSASLRPHYVTTPLEALREQLGDDVEIVHERGCWTEKTTPGIPSARLTAPDGEPGFGLEYFAGNQCAGEPLQRASAPDGQILVFGPPPAGVPDAHSFRATASFVPGESGAHTFTLVQLGRVRVLVNGETLLDGVSDPPPPGEAFFGMGSRELEAQVQLEAGRPAELVVEYSSEGAVLLRGFKLGHRPPLADDLMDRAVAAAEDADAVVLVVGTNSDWESEGHDRESMHLPGDQDELVRRVCAANPRTVVCVNTGSPVTMEWAQAPAAILQTWFGGQEMGRALADVLLGFADPGGRLPTTLPLRVEHNPSFGNFAGENSTLRYGESLLMGYRWYQTRHLPVRFPFGHGMSYSTFAIGEPRLSSPEYRAGETLRIEVTVENTGPRRGTEVVQCYVAPRNPRIFRPAQELKAFEKVWLHAGEQTTVVFELGARAFAHWDPADADWPGLVERLGDVGNVISRGRGASHRAEAGWWIDAGDYELRIGRSSEDIAHVATVRVAEESGPLRD